MGGCASKPKTSIEKEVTPLPVEESKKETTIMAVLKEAKHENGSEKESDDQVKEKKIDVREKKVEEDIQPLSLGCLLIQVPFLKLNFLFHFALQTSLSIHKIHSSYHLIIFSFTSSFLNENFHFS